MRALKAVIAFMILLPGVAAAKTARLEYIFQKRDSTSLLITVSFSGDRSGATLLHLPNEWAGQTMLYKAVSQIPAVSKHSHRYHPGKP